MSHCLEMVISNRLSYQIDNCTFLLAVIRLTDFEDNFDFMIVMRGLMRGYLD